MAESQTDELTDLERQLVVSFVTMAWVRIKDDITMRPEADECQEILRKLGGADKIVRITRA